MTQYMGEIAYFIGDYIPRDWMKCDGQSLKIKDENILYNVLGNFWGGDDENFNVPDAASIFSDEQPINAIFRKTGVFKFNNNGISFVQLSSIDEIFPDPDYLGFIIPHDGTDLPTGWALCNGATLRVIDNQALFSLVNRKSDIEN